MENNNLNKKSAYTKSNAGKEEKTNKEKIKNIFKAQGDYSASSSSSHTQFFKRDFGYRELKRITTDEYLGISESISGTSDTFHCVHGPEGRKYTTMGKLKRNFLKELDPIQKDMKWEAECPPIDGWRIAETLEFWVKDPVACKQIDRIQAYINDFAKISQKGYRLDTLDSLCFILDYLVEMLDTEPSLRMSLMLLLNNTDRPIILNAESDVLTQFETIKNYLGYLGYLLIRLEDDDLFDFVSRAIIWQLSAPDGIRCHGAKLRHILLAAAPVLYQTTARMLALATPHRFSTFLIIALILACDSTDNCIALISENVIENIMSRFNPFFPDDLPPYETTPTDPQDVNVRLGDSGVHMSTSLSLLLVLLTTLKHYLEVQPKPRELPSPDYHPQRCFIWAYRYECRAREHRHERNTLTVIAHLLLKCYGDKLKAFSTLLMPDVMTLSVLTEIPAQRNWTSSVNFNTGQTDVQLKKLLIYLSVDFLKVFPYNEFMVKSQLWLLGLTYLIDPGLSSLRARWSPPLFAEVRKVYLQALVCILPRISPNIACDYNLIRRIMWYIEWYTVNPYELPVLYWCVRLLQVSTYHRHQQQRATSLKDLNETHGVVIIMNLCYRLMEQKEPPIEKSQAIIALALRILTSCLTMKENITCIVYPDIKWPVSVNSLATRMLNIILLSLDKHYIISDRWLISLLNFIWEAIIWKKEYREVFVKNNGVYKLLDLITMTKAPVHVMALAILCDVARSGLGVGQLVTWRAKLSASNAYPNVVRRGSSIVSLLASVFRDECQKTGVKLDENGVIENLNNPLMSKNLREELENPNYEDKSKRTSLCLPAEDLSGSRMSKAYSLLHLLSEDLAFKVSIADEAYKLYKDINISVEDEVIMVLIFNYLTLKLNEVWSEINVQYPKFYPQDYRILQEFLQLNIGWSKEIKRQQEKVLENERIKKIEEENTLFAFLGRVRLNIALDALRDVRCVARSADRTRLVHAMLKEAIISFNNRCIAQTNLNDTLIKTYVLPLDEQNVTGQCVRIPTINTKTKRKNKMFI